MPPRRTGTPPREVVAFGERVRQLRLERGWTQERLAEATGLNAVQVSHIENGLNEPKLTTVLRIARAFKIGAGELLRPLR